MVMEKEEAPPLTPANTISPVGRMATHCALSIEVGLIGLEITMPALPKLESNSPAFWAKKFAVIAPVKTAVKRNRAFFMFTRYARRGMSNFKAWHSVIGKTKPGSNTTTQSS